MKLWVWAPRAERIEVEVAGKRHSLERRGRGYWDADVEQLRHGVDYAFHVDGQGPLPDPRSPWQPYGVFGASRHVDHAAFKWGDAGFRAPPLAAGLVYELHVGTFTEKGTFDAAIERLPHLVSLGVTHVELMPVNEFSGARGWGYDGVDWFAPHHAYGGPEALKRLVDACHRAGLAAVLDVVYNHLGPAGNFLGRFGDYFNEDYRTPWGPAVNFDGAGSDEVRRMVCDNALMWLRDYHFDGLRLDAVHALHDHSSVHVLEMLSREVAALEAEVGRPLVLIAESDFNDARMVRPREAGGLGIDAQWSDDFHHALHALLTGDRASYYGDFGSLGAVAKAIEHVFVYDGQYAPSRKRTHGRPVGETPRTRFLSYLQNHDQIGNRARGDRISTLTTRRRLKMGAALTLAGPFVPMLFQGEEWGTKGPFQYFTDHQDEGLAQAVRDGRRREFGASGWKPEEVPDPQALSTFEASKLDWRELDGAEARDMLEWHRQVVAIRRRAPRGREPARVVYDEGAGWLVMMCSGVAVGVNLGETGATIALESWPEPWRLALTSDDEARVVDNVLSLPPEATVVMVAGR